MHFIPHVFVSIGRDGHFFTLRQTYERVIGRGKRVLSMHVKNLSQTADEAIELAREYANANGMILKTQRHELPDNLEEIYKRRRSEIEAARRERDEEISSRRKALEEAKAERERIARERILNGEFSFGKHNGKRIESEPEYVRWLVGKAAEFEPGSLLEFFCQTVRDKYPDLAVSSDDFTDTYLMQNVGQRVTLSGTVKRVLTFDNDWGLTRFVIIKDEFTGAQVVAKGKWYAEEGKKVTLVGTIKDKSEYKGKKQTVINRVKELANV